MQALSDTAATSPVLPPYPEGWYFVASQQALATAGLIAKRWMGTEIVAWADDQGRACVAESYCPHLGAYLGPDGGGRVREGRLVCPFHGFEFDTTGQCVATPYAAPPRSAALRAFETREIAGMVFAWWGLEGRAPQWHLPAETPEQDGWCEIEIRTLRFPGHPQETTENAVDLAHLRYVHGYDGVDQAESIEVDGAALLSRFSFQSDRRIGPLRYASLDVTAVTSVHGLGYSYVEFLERNLGLDGRLWILSTPVDGDQIDLSIVSQLREMTLPRGLAWPLNALPRTRRTSLLNRFLNYIQHRDVLQDVTIWSRKQYRARPRLCRSDGEIMKYRSYCSQFYPAKESAAAVSEDRSGDMQAAAG